MRTLAAVTTALIALSMLSGCTNASGVEPSTTSEGPSSAPTASGEGAGQQPAPVDAVPTTPRGSSSDLSGLASDLGCGGYALSTTIAPGAAEYGTCQLNGVRIQLYEFANLDDKQVFLEQVEVYGVVESQLAFTPDGLVAAAPADQTLLAQLKESLAN